MTSLPRTLGACWIAVLLPLISFFLILCFGPWMGKAGSGAAYVATGAIGLAGVLSFVSLFTWLAEHGDELGTNHALVAPQEAANVAQVHDAHANPPPTAYTDVYYLLGQFGELKLEQVVAFLDCIEGIADKYATLVDDRNVV